MNVKELSYRNLEMKLNDLCNRPDSLFYKADEKFKLNMSGISFLFRDKIKLRVAEFYGTNIHVSGMPVPFGICKLELSYDAYFKYRLNFKTFKYEQRYTEEGREIIDFMKTRFNGKIGYSWIEYYDGDRYDRYVGEQKWLVYSDHIRFVLDDAAYDEFKSNIEKKMSDKEKQEEKEYITKLLAAL